MKTKYLLLLIATCSFFSKASCAESTPKQTMESVYPILKNLPELSTFASLVEKAGLIHFFSGSGPFTVFAPSNTAFEQMDVQVFALLQKPENKGALIDLINYHVLLGAYHMSNLKTGSYRTINGKDINVRVENGQILVNNAKVMGKEMTGPNGVGYIIDKVLMIP